MTSVVVLRPYVSILSPVEVSAYHRVPFVDVGVIP